MTAISQTYDFQVAQADAAAIEAGEAALENARLRALRSEAAWREMADRTLRMQKEREKARRARELQSFAMLEPERKAAP
ncbi:hypothetical protein ED21_23716 [Erythrobacter sp. SD-21]|nr:hypothetical protein ED21_23716 [Erythrobacter sp. SD-21]